MIEMRRRQYRTSHNSFCIIQIGTLAPDEYFRVTLGVFAALVHEGVQQTNVEVGNYFPARHIPGIYWRLREERVGAHESCLSCVFADLPVELALPLLYHGVAHAAEKGGFLQSSLVTCRHGVVGVARDLLRAGG